MNIVNYRSHHGQQKSSSSRTKQPVDVVGRRSRVVFSLGLMNMFHGFELSEIPRSKPARVASQ